MSSSSGEDILGGLIGTLLVIAAAITLVVVAGMILIPVSAAILGGLFWYRNSYKPKEREREATERADILRREALAITPPAEALDEKLAEWGFFDEDLRDLAKTLYEMEGLTPPSKPTALGDTIMHARYRDQLQKHIENSNPDHLKNFHLCLRSVLAHLESSDDPSALFHSKRPRTRDEVEDLMQLFVNDENIFEKVMAQINRNYNEEDAVNPAQSKHDDYIWRYLKHTPLLDFQYIEQNVSLTNRMYHTYLLGSSGSGKTNLLENIIAHDLRGDDDCCVVVIDSQTQLTNKLAALDIPDTTYITPEWNLALNLFDVGYDEMRSQGIEGETLINKTVGLISFVMEGMMGAAFTNPQKTIFQYAIQLVISIKGGNIFTFMDVLSDDGHLKFAAQIAQFDDNTRRFFEKDFGSDDYKRSREAIRRRLDSLLLNPTFRRLFATKENKFNMFEELRTKRLILIDTNKPMLDDDASAFFGRLFIAMIVRAAHLRFNKSHEEFRPVYLIVDEAHEYFDQSISDMLEQARKANIGLIVAHQSISQAKGEGRRNISDPLMVNTATKIVWTAFRDDAAKFSGSMIGVSPDDILSLPQFTFGMYARQAGWTPIRGKANAFADFPRREDRNELKQYMEANYGASEISEDPTEETWTKDKPRTASPPLSDELPDVELI